jgi:hypothetical protein
MHHVLGASPELRGYFCASRNFDFAHEVTAAAARGLQYSSD